MRNERVPRRHKTLATITVLGVGMASWYLLTRDQSSQEALHFPSPKLVARTLMEQWRNIGWYALTTWYRVLLGLTIGSMLGMVAGLLMTYSRFLYYVLDPVVEVVRPIPPIALTPFFILWLGLGDLSQLLLITLGCFMIITISTYVAVTNVNPVFARAARSLGASKPFLYRTVYLPAILPELLSGIRVALASAFALTVAAEYLGAQGGLGFLIRNARTILHTETILLAAVILGVQSTLTDRLIRWIFRRLTRWAPEHPETANT
jgi:ABC-type nitrate/sulfonate/bicarbonate transport system permease component